MPLIVPSPLVSCLPDLRRLVDYHCVVQPLVPLGKELGARKGESRKGHGRLVHDAIADSEAKRWKADTYKNTYWMGNRLDLVSIFPLGELTFLFAPSALFLASAS